MMCLLQPIGADVTSVDTIVLAMPPSAHEELLAELSPLLSNQLVVTVALALVHLI